MGLYKNELANFTTPVRVEKPTYITSGGVTAKTGYTKVSEFLCSFKAKGTETNVDGLIVIQETANILCWYNPEITSECRIVNLLNNKIYDIIGDVENIDNLNKRMKFRTMLHRGGA